MLIYLEKVRTENLKFWIDLRHRVMNGWSVTQQMIVYKGRLLEKSSNRKSKLVLSLVVTYMAFKHRISFATDLAANFGYFRFRIMPDIVSRLLRAAI